jgi:hypothetical protein
MSLLENLRRWPARIAFILFFGAALYGYWRPESDLQDKKRVEMFDRAFKAGYISISQPAPGDPLEPKVEEFSNLKPSDQEYFGENQWSRLRQQIFRFTGAVNQGLGDPFEYKETDDDRAYVTGVKHEALVYQNPFGERHLDYVTTPINSSEQVAQRRQGWRIVSKNLVLYLRPGGGPPMRISTGAQDRCEVAGSFILEARSPSDRTLIISADGRGLQLELPGASGSQGRVIPRRHGEYFVWDGRPFSVFRTDSEIRDANDPTVGDLVFTKMVNGRAQRVQVLGRATANLIGSPIGGETGAIDGAFRHGSAQRLVLSIDPELQSGVTFLLSSALNRMANHPSSVQRGRRGVVTILDATTGQMLAHVGAPSYDPEWEGQRIILANRRRIVDNPANAVHMPGSAIKVLTAGMGYLLFGDGTGSMLPTSVNKLAIRQAFRNSYGGDMPPDNIVDNTDDADVTEAGNRYFEQRVGTRHVLNREFMEALNTGFYMLHYNPAPERYRDSNEEARREFYEPVAPGSLAKYFDPTAKYDFLPVRSRFPVQNADSLGVFRQMAIGGNETQLTMLRLAAVLGTVSSGQLMQPYLIESVFDRSSTAPKQQVMYQRSDIFSNLRPILTNVQGAHNGNDQVMTNQMQEFLKLVCIRGDGRTGFYYYASDSKILKIFMTENDPSTPEDESLTRRGDYGKTGTADYGGDEKYDDSVFVYRHDRYLIGIWLERAEGPGIQHPAHALLNEVVKFIDRLEPPQ